jgi:NAD(P)-dependent dehydrogenase (short-subunit alcohol dehydrogenase family)
MTDYPLQGRTIFITGGANGIGAETGRQAAQRGARVALVDIDGAAAERTAAGLPSAIGIEADVRDNDSLEAAVRRTVDEFGGIDVVMANAGIGTIGTAESMSLDEIERIVDINLTGVMRTVRATVPHLLDSRGYLLITASLAAILHTPPLTHYAATKAGAEAFGHSIRIELADRGVDVGVAYFGFIDTDMVAQGNANHAVSSWRAAHPRASRGPLGIIRVFEALRGIAPRISEKALASQDVNHVVRDLNAAVPGDPPAKAEAALAETLTPES